MENLDIISDDAPLIAVNKPSGVVSQGAPPGLLSLAEQVKLYLKQKYNKPGNVYLGIPHRLDRPVSGVSVFSRNSKCAARLAEQFASRSVKKTYRAILENSPPEREGVLEDWIYRFPDQSRVEIRKPESPGTKFARLKYRVLAQNDKFTLVEIDLETGRMHQIRVQFSKLGCPVVGDEKYGSQTQMPNPESIALHAYSLTLKHPIRYEEMTIIAPLPPSWTSFKLQ